MTESLLTLLRAARRAFDEDDTIEFICWALDAVWTRPLDLAYSHLKGYIAQALDTNEVESTGLDLWLVDVLDIAGHEDLSARIGRCDEDLGWLMRTAWLDRMIYQLELDGTLP